MPLLAILFVAYFVVGVVVSIVVAASDLSKKRTSVAGLFGDIASLHAIGFVIFIVLWPLWLALILFAADEGENPAAKDPAKPKPGNVLADEKKA